MEEIENRNIELARFLEQEHGKDHASVVAAELIRGYSFDMKIGLLIWIFFSAVFVVVTLYFASVSTGPAVVFVNLLTLIGCYVFFACIAFLVDVFRRTKRAVRDAKMFIENPEAYTYLYEILFKIPWGIRVTTK